MCAPTVFRANLSVQTFIRKWIKTAKVLRIISQENHFSKNRYAAISHYKSFSFFFHIISFFFCFLFFSASFVFLFFLCFLYFFNSIVLLFHFYHYFSFFSSSILSYFCFLIYLSNFCLWFPFLSICFSVFFIQLPSKIEKLQEYNRLLYPFIHTSSRFYVFGFTLA